MYDELIKDLRELCEMTALCDDHSCFECPYEEECGSYKNGRLSAVYRQAADAIEELQQIAGHYEEAAKDYFKDVCYYLERVPKWIPVTEEPPLKVGDDGYNGYLVYANGYYEVADYTTDKFDNAPYFHVNGEYEPGVTHWMPLPQPPEEE